MFSPFSPSYAPEKIRIFYFFVRKKRFFVKNKKKVCYLCSLPNYPIKQKKRKRTGYRYTLTNIPTGKCDHRGRRGRRGFRRPQVKHVDRWKQYLIRVLVPSLRPKHQTYSRREMWPPWQAVAKRVTRTATRRWRLSRFPEALPSSTIPLAVSGGDWTTVTLIQLI